jgi:hypothetical protein
MKSLKKTIKKLSEESNELIHMSQNFDAFSQDEELRGYSVADKRDVKKRAFDLGYEINQNAHEMLKKVEQSESSLKHFL